MAAPPAPTGGTIPLTEYRRDVPPGWSPGDPGYTLRSYLEKLRLWYRICSLEDEHVGPVIAGRLYGRAHRIAMQLRVPRPDGNVDQGDAALVRLPVDEVRDPNTNEVIQQAIPSGVQFLVNALRQAFGQMDQDLATAALESFFSLSKHGSKLSLSEFSVEFDSRYEEAHERAGLQLNDVAKYYLWFKGSGLPPRTIDDIKLQVNGDFRRFEDARALALRITPNKETKENEIFYGHDEDEWWYDAEEYNQYYETAADYDDYYADEYDWWYGYEADGDGPGEWVYEDADGYEWHEDDAAWESDGPNTTTSANVEPENTEASNIEAKYEEYYKGKSKGKGGNDGCFNCGSKWHLARDCSMAKGAGKKGGKGKGRGTWRWRPSYKGKGKGKFRNKGFGKSYGKKGRGKNHWYTGTKTLDLREGIPDHTTSTSSSSHSTLFVKDKIQSNVAGKTIPEKHVIHTSSEEEDFMSRRNPNKVFATSTTSSTDGNATEETIKPEKQHSFNFPTFHNTYTDGQYFSVKGEKRYGLLIDPGAASGLVGSDTLRELVDQCVKPAGRQGEMVIDHGKVVPVSGINGTTESTLGQVTVPLVSGGHALTYTADVLGGEGSYCPALVGNPALRDMNAVIFSNWFQGGDGLIMVGAPQDDIMHHRMFRLLLTDSGHYMLPTDQGNSEKVPGQAKREAVLFCAKAAARSTELWTDVHPRVQHCFVSNVGMQAGVDRGEAGENGESGEAGENDEVGNPGEASEESVEDSGNNPDGIGKIGGDGSQLSSGHQPVEPPPTCSESTKKVRFNEQPPTEDAVTKQVVDIEPKNTGGGKVSQPAILAPEEARVSSHDIIYYDKVDVLDKTPADDEVSPTSDAILATWSSEPYVEDKFPEDADVAKLNKQALQGRS